jgi:hypothetical protein
MKKIALLCAALLTLTAMSANAAGLNLRWTNCFGDGGLANKTSACTSNLGSNVLVGSYMLASDVNSTGIELIVDLATAGTALPAWFTTACRTGFITANPTISTAAVNCFDWANGAAAGGLAAYNQGNLYGPSSARVLMGFAVPAPGQLVPADNEMFAFNLVISNAKTTGTGSCAGCSTPACIQFNNLKMASGIVTGAILNTATAPGSNVVTWQGGAGVSSTLGGGCPAAVPTRNATWSGVKSLYR